MQHWQIKALELEALVLKFLDGVIADDGVYFYLVFVWLSLLVLAWVFSGGLRRKFPNQPHVRAGIGIIIQPHTPPPSPTIIIHEYDPPDYDCDDHDWD
ncbi:MAG: hypothetical protein WBS33_09745 [Verrucomicrobiia bacterium]